eukprot:Platyproteum_vivax@DN12834_c0_g1_i1.p1
MKTADSTGLMYLIRSTVAGWTNYFKYGFKCTVVWTRTTQFLGPFCSNLNSNLFQTSVGWILMGVLLIIGFFISYNVWRLAKLAKLFPQEFPDKPEATSNAAKSLDTTPTTPIPDDARRPEPGLSLSKQHHPAHTLPGSPMRVEETVLQDGSTGVAVVSEFDESVNVSTDKLLTQKVLLGAAVVDTIQSRNVKAQYEYDWSQGGPPEVKSDAVVKKTLNFNPVVQLPKMVRKLYTDVRHHN